MEARITTLETDMRDVRDRLVRVEVKLDGLTSESQNFATKDSVKAAVSEAKNSIIMWVVSAIFLAQLLPTLLKKFGL